MNPKRLITSFFNVLRFYGYNPDKIFPLMNQEDKLEVLRNYYVLGTDELRSKLSFES